MGSPKQRMVNVTFHACLAGIVFTLTSIEKICQLVFVIVVCTYVESKGGGAARLALHRGDGGDHRATGHDCTVHLHPLVGGWGGRVPGPHLTGLQIGKLKDTTPPPHTQLLLELCAKEW